jgi:hypothetical protein
MTVVCGRFLGGGVHPPPRSAARRRWRSSATRRRPKCTSGSGHPGAETEALRLAVEDYYRTVDREGRTGATPTSTSTRLPRPLRGAAELVEKSSSLYSNSPIGPITACTGPSFGLGRPFSRSDPHRLPPFLRRSPAFCSLWPLPICMIGSILHVIGGPPIELLAYLCRFWLF